MDFIIRRHFLNGQRKLDNLPDDVVGASVEGATVVVAGGGGGRAMQPSPLAPAYFEAFITTASVIANCFF